MSKRITLVGEVDPVTGYGQHSEYIVRELESLGYYPSVRAIRKCRNISTSIARRIVQEIQPEEIEVFCAPAMHAPTPGKTTIFYTMWESTRLPETCVNMLNLAQHVVVPCEWNKNTFVSSGVTSPISVVPLGIDPDVYGYRPKGNQLKCVFGCAGNIGNGRIRKGMDDVIDAFQVAFPGRSDVELWVKVLGGKMDNLNDDRIKVFDKPMHPMGLPIWFASLTCFVSCARAEGWGLMQHQAMAVGTPVIAPVYGGLAEFMDNHNSFAVDFTEGPAQELWSGYGDWAIPDVRHVVVLMEHVYQNRKHAIEVGRVASESAHRFTWKESVGKLASIIESYDQANHHNPSLQSA